MASTNKTSGYSLSQFIGSDIPSWLGDYNGDMLKIDTALTSINATATGAQSTATSASSQAQAAQNTANSALQTANKNEDNIANLKTSLTNSPLNIASIGNMTSIRVVFTASNFAVSIRGRCATPDESKPTTTYVVGTNTRIPLFSVTGNIFDLSVSNATDNNSKFYVGMSTVSCIRTNEASSIIPADLTAYYDGANTIVFITISTEIYSTMNKFLDCWFSNTCLLTGSVLAPLNY